MISHRYKCIFIHIPKTAGTSINSFFYPGTKFHYASPDYKRLFGWCPKRKLHMQHATARQLIETNLITEEHWNTYYKFTFVRNPWDRAYSDYIWIKNFSKVSGSFREYILKTGEFKKIFTNKTSNRYLGDHLLPQTDFFEFEGVFKPDFIGRFEQFKSDIQSVISHLEINKKFEVYQNKSKRKSDYSLFYTETKKKLVEKKFQADIQMLHYEFEDNRRGFYKLKKFL